MSERTVVVEGVRMTKVALEKALEEITRVDFQPGDIVQWADARESDTPRFVVVGADVRAALCARHEHIRPDYVVVINLADGESYSGRPFMYEKAKTR